MSSAGLYKKLKKHPFPFRVSASCSGNQLETEELFHPVSFRGAIRKIAYKTGGISLNLLTCGSFVLLAGV